MTYLFVAILMMSPRSLCRSRWSDQEHKLLIWDSVIRHHPHIIMIIEMQRYVGTMVMNNISWSWLALQGDYHSMHTPDRLKDSLRWLIMIMMMIPEDWSDWRKRPCRWLEACCCEDAARPTCSDWKASRRAALLIKKMTLAGQEDPDADLIIEEYDQMIYEWYHDMLMTIMITTKQQTDKMGGWKWQRWWFFVVFLSLPVSWLCSRWRRRSSVSPESTQCELKFTGCNDYVNNDYDHDNSNAWSLSQYITCNIWS